MESDTLRTARDTAWAMSQENVELRYRAADAFTRHDLDALLALCDPDVMFISRHLGLEGGGGSHHGHDGVRSWWESLLGVFPTSARSSMRYETSET